MPEVWRLLELSAPEDPVWNMALDSCFLESTRPAVPTLRFYRWSRPALSIGYFQSVSKITDAFDCDAQNLWVVRRPTGGGLVRHGADLTLSLCLPENHPRLSVSVSESYRAVHAVILDALRPMYPDLDFSACAAPLKPRSERLCFEEPVACDLERAGGKVVGSSQRRKNGRLLHQTSIQLPGAPAEMAHRIVRMFEESWNIVLRAERLTTAEAEEAKRLARFSAASAEWSFVGGKSPVFP